MILMAIDASTKATGVAIFDNGRLTHHECIYANDTNMLTRIDKITEKLEEMALEYHVAEVALEDVVREDVKNNDSIFRALMYLQGAIAIHLNRIGLKINKLFIASEWRATVGIKTGRGIRREALKKASIKLTKDHYNIDVNDDEADAVGIGVAYLKKQDEEFNWE